MDICDITHQGPILTLAYSLIHEHWINKRKDKIASFTYTETFHIYIIYSFEVLSKIHKCVPTNKICTCCSMNKQYMKGIRKHEKSMGFTFQWQYSLPWGKTVTTVQQTEIKSYVLTVQRTEWKRLFFLSFKEQGGKKTRRILEMSCIQEPSKELTPTKSKGNNYLLSLSII